ncbi:tetratricopeptide repeat protein [Saccharothrix algeriensis]|uniref:Flp pilus assembly protein TadD n=1 Tax=Saccharothrix algeriensis TaxID=173560 RepID=A0ABS2S585_9PSEU|nr:tetratricopeptide repeat protein [Saccharothrix algeriensis]MBM7811110.1 Flp pilus assembly protein TadD [Saccharothrix algeriensis]
MSESIAAVVFRAADLTARGLPRQAIDLLRPALAAHPRHAEAWCRLAAAYLDTGEPDPALTAAKRALALDGDHAWAQRLAALALSELGRHPEAAVAARECVRREPGDWRCHVVLAEVLAAVPDTRDAAVDAAREAARLAPGEARAFQVLGDAALRVRDWGTAEWAYRKALRLDPADEDVRANLATVTRKRSAAPASPTADALTTAHGLARRTLSRLAALLVAGGVLLMIAGLPRPTPSLGWFSGALVLAAVAVAGRPFAFARPAVRAALRVLPRHRPKVAVAAAAFGLSASILAGWSLALLLGATTAQPLVLAWLCALAGGSVVVLAGGR